MAGDYPLFCATVGWKLSAGRSPSLDFTYSLKAPVGHLPSRRWAKGFELWRSLKALDEKLSQCFPLPLTPTPLLPIAYCLLPPSPYCLLLPIAYLP